MTVRQDPASLSGAPGRLPVGSSATTMAGIGLRILSGAGGVAMFACVKAMGGRVPLGEVVFFRSAVSLLPLVLFLMWCREWPGGLATRRPASHLMRCLTGCVGMFTGFAAVRLLPIAEATLLTYLSPLFVVLLAGWLLGEQVRLVRWVGVAVGLAGAAVLLGPEAAAPSTDPLRLLGLGMGVATALLMALALMQVRRLTRTESTGAIAFYFALVCSVAGLLTLPLGWVMPGPIELLLLVGTGIFGGLTHITMTVSFRFAEASALAPFEYLTILWAVLTGAVLFGEEPGVLFALATLLVVAGAMLVLHDELRRRRAAAPSL